MIIKKIHIENYKLIRKTTFSVNQEFNIFVGDNDSGKSTLLEIISIISTGKLDGYAFDKQLKANLFNDNARREYITSIAQKTPQRPPTIILEAYCESGDTHYLGTNNELGEKCCGIRVKAEINEHYLEAYRKMMDSGELNDIPVELYKVSYNYFNGDPIIYKHCPIKVAVIDTTKKVYGGIVDRFVSENITSFLSEEEQTDLSTAYRKIKSDFHNNDVILRLNESVRQNVHIAEKQISIDLKEEDTDSWKRQMSVVVDTTPFENIGFGTQNIIKIELAIKNSERQSNLILLEEPENNLSYTNMAKLIQHICDSKDKQIFISTHSSYVANKLNLGNIFLVRAGKVFPFTNLEKETQKYFQKLPGHDTLRMVLSKKTILVEGPTDELIISKAYFDKRGKLPTGDGIDIIVVNSLAFKRYLDIAVLIEKPVVVVTDNDRSVDKNIKEKYSNYKNIEFITYSYEGSNDLYTIEPSILNANLEDNKPSETFVEAISKNGSMRNKTKEEILDFMINNKPEWALRVFESSLKINYPKYITDVIEKRD